LRKLPKIQPGTAWEIKDTDSIITKHLSEVYPVAFAKVMCNRGLYEVSAVEDFLHCALSDLPQHKIEEQALCNAAERVLGAIENGEKIVVYGDYDVDGVTSTALVTEVIRNLGGDVDYFIPNRLTDGYGLSAKRIGEMADRGVRLVITVDCGINAMEEVELLKSRGVDVIITDHHEPKFDPQADLFTASGLKSFVLPNAFSIINPKIENCSGASSEAGYFDLAGVGVAFMLCWCVVRKAGQKKLKKAANIKLQEYLDLVALGTIADVVPLYGQNRIFVKYGLTALKGTARPGLRKLIEKTRAYDCDVKDVTFSLAPRLNAPGRVTDASTAVELMLTKDAVMGEVLVNELEDANKERQRIEKETFRKAQAAFEKTLPPEFAGLPKIPGGLPSIMPDGPNVIVVAGENWNPGVIGIVASRMVERYGLPAVIIAMQGDTGKGSCRSCGNFHMFDALRRCGDLLENYGGHRIAAGLSVKRDQIDALRTELDRLAKEARDCETQSTSLEVDALVTLEELDEELIGLVGLCEPYGAGNPEPMFAVKGVYLADEPQVIKGKHLKFMVVQNGVYREVFAYNWKERLYELESLPQFDMVVYPYLNDYRNSNSIELQLVDIRPCEEMNKK